MIQFEDAILRKIVHHKISSSENASIISDSLFDISNEDEENILKRILLKPFSNIVNTEEFYHEVDLKFNVLYNIAKNIYSEEDFLTNTKNIAKHLISVSNHPNIKEGDLFIAKFEDLKFGGKYLEGIGIYKFEEKELFLETKVFKNDLKRSFRKGIGNKKPEKGCLILFSEEPFTLLIIDNNKNETDYWQNDFIQHKSKNDYVNNTNDFLTITKSFITSQIQNELEITKADQIDLLNKSVDYFKRNINFDKQEFEKEVFVEEEIIDMFHKFDNNYRQETKVEISNNFEISSQVVKKQARSFKSVLKLDKNFHVYIHGDRDKIEKGVDESGRKFYKLYYDTEI